MQHWFLSARILFLSVPLIFSTASVIAQKKVIDPTVYNDWKSLKNHQISPDGNYISYEVNPHRGDGYLYIYSVQNDRLDSIPRGSQAQFSGNSGYLAFRIAPGYDTIRTCELEKVNKKKWPKDTLGIYIPDRDSLQKFPGIQSFSTADESSWMTVLFDHNRLEEKGKEKITKRKREKRKKKHKKKKEPTSKGKKMLILNPMDGTRISKNNVQEYHFSKKGKLLVYTTHEQDAIDSMRLFIFDTSKKKVTHSSNSFVNLSSFQTNNLENQLVFLGSNDTSELKNYALHHWDLTRTAPRILMDSTKTAVPKGDQVSNELTPRFSDDGLYVFFGVAEQQKKAPEDTLTKSEKVTLDIWHYADKRLQPQQLRELKRDQKKVDVFVYHLEKGKAIQLSNDTLSVKVPYQGRWNAKDPHKYVLAVNTDPYRHTYNWVAPYPEDHYVVSLETGEIRAIKMKNDMGGMVSPAGNYYTYFDSESKNHFAIDLSSNEENCLTCSVDGVTWEVDVNGMPMKATSYGIIGWTADERSVFIQSELDLWKYNFESGALESFTEGIGARDNLEMRLRKWSSDSVYLDPKNIYIRAFNRTTKGVSFFGVSDDGGLEEYASYDADIVGVQRAKNGAKVLLRKMTVEHYPDVFLATNKMRIIQRISKTNPQQGAYNWVSVEILKWKSYDGTPLEGLLYKPENYDPERTYPLMVYFYELYSDTYHRHYIPKPTASIIYPTEYASAGYIVFIPDIRYRPGHPGKSAYDCIMSGTDHVLASYPNIDSTRMALQGQSWGGYQTAQLVTMTNRYKAAMAGAPVTNMFSAYGGIRWGSGLNRQFQYERTQSRIGHTIWEAPELYIENSPQFHLPNVKTPLLIMHNDQDGAVPWYQGIELFTGLKRLGKKVWMLNYNDEKHNLRKNANRMDLSIRMRQFFDHYLHDQPAPKWMTEGIPALQKGKELGY